MPYKCVHCSKTYADGASEVLSGCGECQSKFFFYIKQEKLKEIKQKEDEDIGLTEKEKEQMEEDIREISGIEDEETPVFLDFESVKVLRSGKYLLDVAKLFEMGKPKVYKLEDGKYIIELPPIIKKG